MLLSRLGDPRFDDKYHADSDSLADLIPRVWHVVSQRYAQHERGVTTFRVGALTEDETTACRWKVGGRRPAESAREQ